MFRGDGYVNYMPKRWSTLKFTSTVNKAGFSISTRPPRLMEVCFEDKLLEHGVFFAGESEPGGKERSLRRTMYCVFTTCPTLC